MNDYQDRIKYAFNINTTSKDIGGNQNIKDAITEIIQNVFTLILRFARMHSTNSMDRTSQQYHDTYNDYEETWKRC